MQPSQLVTVSRIPVHHFPVVVIINACILGAVFSLAFQIFIPLQLYGGVGGKRVKNKASKKGSDKEIGGFTDIPNSLASPQS